MSRKIRFETPQINYYSKKENNDEKKGTLKFSKCDNNKYPLHELNKKELKEFINFAKKFEQMSWLEIKSYTGFKFENIKGLDKPKDIDEDIILSSLRVSEKFRLIGYRNEECFYIVWFDKNHDAYNG